MISGGLSKRYPLDRWTKERAIKYGNVKIYRKEWVLLVLFPLKRTQSYLKTSNNSCGLFHSLTYCSSTRKSHKTEQAYASFCCFDSLRNSSMPLFPTPLSWSLASDSPLQAKHKQMAAFLCNSTMLWHTHAQASLDVARSRSHEPAEAHTRLQMQCACTYVAAWMKAHMSNHPCMCTADSWTHAERQKSLWTHKHAVHCPILCVYFRIILGFIWI